MKTLPTLILCVTGAAAGAGFGWLLRGAPPSRAENVVATTTGSVHSTASHGPGKAAAAARSKAEDELRTTLASRNGAMRWLTLLGAAEKATAAEMPGILRAAEGLPGAVKMLATRWAELDPQHMLATLRAADGRGGVLGDGRALNVLFEVWTSKSPEAAIAALQDLTAFPRAENMRMTVSNFIMKADPARALQLITQWGFLHYLPDMGPLKKWAEQNPQAAATALVSAKLGKMSEYYMKAVGKAWAASDPAAALRFAGETGGMAGAQLAQAVIAQWGAIDLPAALAHVGGMSDPFLRNRLGLPLMESWAKTDPRAALAWSAENLTGEARNAATGEIVKAMAAQDRHAAAAFLATLESGPARSMALRKFSDEWLGDAWMNNGDKAEATAALTWLTALADPAEREAAMVQTVWRLMHRAPDETIAFLSTPQGAQAPAMYFAQAARHLAGKNPESAVHWATQLPESRRAVAMESVLDEWATQRPDAAMDWVRAQPAGETRASYVTAMTQRLSYGAPGNSRRWLESLPASDHAAARAALRHVASRPEENAALEALLK